MINYNDGRQMKLQKVEKLGKSFISSIKIYERPFTSAIRFEPFDSLSLSLSLPVNKHPICAWFLNGHLMDVHKQLPVS